MDSSCNSVGIDVPELRLAKALKEAIPWETILASP
jgi:hypothetical protein